MKRRRQVSKHTRRWAVPLEFSLSPISSSEGNTPLSILVAG
jgi:hypothetical protein